jgi:hypothetical protein
MINTPSSCLTIAYAISQEAGVLVHSCFIRNQTAPIHVFRIHLHQDRKRKADHESRLQNGKVAASGAEVDIQPQEFDHLTLN